MMVDNNIDSLPRLDLFSKRLDDMPNLFGSMWTITYYIKSILIIIRYLAFIEVIVESINFQ